METVELISTEPNNFGSFRRNTVHYCLSYFTRFAISWIVYFVFSIALHICSWLSWHMILCVFGYVPLMAESVMLFTGDELWSRQMSRKAKYTVHGVIVTIATLMIIAGDALVFHYIEPGYHLYTAHGITGLISLILVLLSIPAGLVIKYHRELNPHLPIRLVWFKAVHNILGIAGYVVGIVSLVYAYYTNWFVFYTEYKSRLAAAIVTVLAAAWTLNGAFVSLFSQVKSLISGYI